MPDTGGAPRPPLRRFLGYVYPHRLLIVGAALAGTLKFLLPLTFPLALKYLTDVVLVAEGPAGNDATNRWIEAACVRVLAAAPWLGEGAAGRLAAVGTALLLLYVLLGAASFLRSYWAGQAGHRLVFDLRHALYQHVQGLSHSFFDRHRSGAIVARFVSDISLAQNFVGAALTNVWMDTAALAFVVAILFLLEPRLAVVALAVMPAYVALIRFFRPRLREASRSVQEMLEDFSGDLQERIAGASVIKAFGREEWEARRFRGRSQRLLDLTLRNVRLSSANMAATSVLTSVAPLVVVWVAGIMVLQGDLSVGTLVAFYAYLGSLYLPLQRFSELSVVVTNSLAAMQRIFEFFDIRPEVEERAGAVALPRVRGEVVFEGVNFRYPGVERPDPVLRGVSLSVAAGETLALVGRSGAGKSTLVSLLPRFYDVSAGAIRIDGHDVRDLKLVSLRDCFGIVPQDPLLFSGTIFENLRYGNPEATEAEILMAARSANAAEFMDRLPDGYATTVGERGVRLSGGQRQRIAIARAFLRNPPILILDEATSALDSESEGLIHEALRRLMAGRTTFLIAHRLSTVRQADRIAVLEGGAVVELGRHEELLKAGGVYARLHADPADSVLDASPELSAGMAREESWRPGPGPRRDPFRLAR